MQTHPVIAAAIRRGAAVAISVSGGKDSQAMESFLVGMQEAWPGPVFAIHADLGRMDWPQSLPHCQELAILHGLELIVVRRPQGDLLERIEQRMRSLAGTGKPFWPSAATRYCTNELKTAQINRWLRRYELVISAEGIRAEESHGRAKKSAVSVRKDITTERLKELSAEEALAAWWPGGGRLALTWYPIHDWRLEQVWQACGTSLPDIARRRALYRTGQYDEALADCPVHHAYIFGNERVSCALCVLASRNDLAVGARHNPDLYNHLVRLEQQSDISFRTNLTLSKIQIPTEANRCITKNSN